MFMKSFRVSSGAVLVLGLALASTPMAATAKTITVRSGQSIQAAVDAAKSGDTVKVQSGVYDFTGKPGTDYCAPWLVGYPACTPAGKAAVVITKPLTLTASGPVSIKGGAVFDETGHCTTGLRDGIVVVGTKEHNLDGVEIKGFNVESFCNNGIALAYVTNFNIENNVAGNLGEVGIWPVLSANGQVKKNVAYGTIDSALWVEASQNVRVINNDLSQSPTGLEVTISQNITMENNNIHNNTTGVGLYHPAGAGLPQELWPAGPYRDWHVVKNDVYDNNYENPVLGGLVGEIPAGLGVLISGVSHVDVQKNRIERNNYIGVAMIDWCLGLGDPTCSTIPLPPGYEDATVNYVQVVANKFAGNGLEPPVGGPFPGADIFYIGADAYDEVFGVSLPSGTGNCQSDNKLIKTPTPKNPGPVVIAQPGNALPACQ
jgi:parallel beta-helix repeat protein